MVVCYNRIAFTASEDKATLGSDLSADAGFSEGGFIPERTAVIALWKTKAINPFRILKSPVVHFIYFAYGSFG